MVQIILFSKNHNNDEKSLDKPTSMSDNIVIETPKETDVVVENKDLAEVRAGKKEYVLRENAAKSVNADVFITSDLKYHDFFSAENQIILADIGIIYFGKKILEKLKLPVHNIFLYALNPFIIIELTGNLHFESVMIFFLVWSLYLLLQKKWSFAALTFGLSVSVKLIPLLFLPLFYQWFTKENRTKGVLRFISFGMTIVLINILLFLPFLSSNLMNNYLDSIGLWFQKFEFNASLYYIARELGTLFRGYNEIAIIGKITPIVVVIFLLIITFFRKNKSPQQLITALLMGISFYYFTTTTMHPWYLATLVILSVFTNYRFPIIWSLVVVLSYQAYANTPWKENIWFMVVEYLVVYGYLFWEIIQQNLF
mgnify:CR=1 FL=1